MGLFDQLAQTATSMFGQGGGKQDHLLQVLTQLLGKDSSIGGLNGLIQAFQKSGLSEIVNSWVSAGANLPISPEQIQQGLGSPAAAVVRRNRVFPGGLQQSIIEPAPDPGGQADA